MMVEYQSSVLGVVGLNPRASDCLLLWGTLWQLPVKQLPVGGLGLQTWFGVFEARLSCGRRLTNCMISR